MHREHEEAMRADFAEMDAMAQRAYAPDATQAAIDRFYAEGERTDRRWYSGPHAAEWGYLRDAYADWAHSPAAMHRLIADVEHNGGFGMSEVQYRSQLQARALTGNDRPRPEHEQQRSR